MRVLVAGGGYVGMYSALHLEGPLAALGHELVLVNPENFMTYQPFLPEASSGNIEPRHVVVALRHVLHNTTVVAGEVERVDHPNRTALVRMATGDERELTYDHVVLGPGSLSRVLPVPGLAERGVGFKTVTEAIYLRNKVLTQLELAAQTEDRDRRRAALAFVFVGGGYAGVEALAELEDLARSAMRFYPNLRAGDMRWVLVEATGSILPEIGEDLAAYAIERLRSRGVEILLETRLDSAEDGVMRLSNGAEFAADTLVWTTGVKPHPLAARSGFPVVRGGRVLVDPYLRIRDAEQAWAAGDSAAVPDLEAGGFTPPTAQHALRQAKRLARNLVATLRGDPLQPFRYKNKGQLVSLGRYKGVAKVMGISMSGFPAWALHRSYHLAMMPTLNRKVRIALDWTVGLVFPRDVVQLGSLSRPREPFEQATKAS
jgi:NADH:ubiquinone reductase (H+-translocating)